MPKELTKLKGIVDKGLERTAALWPDVRVGFDLIHRAAHRAGRQAGVERPGRAAAVQSRARRGAGRGRASRAPE